MKALILLAFVPALSFGQVPDPLEEAYRALKRNDYDVAISAFLQAVAAKPERSDIRKDLAYTYLKVGQSEAARDQFGEAMRLDPADATAGLEDAFL